MQYSTVFTGGILINVSQNFFFPSKVQSCSFNKRRFTCEYLPLRLSSDGSILLYKTISPVVIDRHCHPRDSNSKPTKTQRRKNSRSPHQIKEVHRQSNFVRFWHPKVCRLPILSFVRKLNWDSCALLY